MGCLNIKFRLTRTWFQIIKIPLSISQRPPHLYNRKIPLPGKTVFIFSRGPTFFVKIAVNKRQIFNIAFDLRAAQPPGQRPLLLTRANFNRIMDMQSHPSDNVEQITYLLTNFSGTTVEVWELISKFILYFTGHKITHPCWNWRLSMKQVHSKRSHSL